MVGTVNSRVVSGAVALFPNYNQTVSNLSLNLSFCPAFLLKDGGSGLCHIDKINTNVSFCAEKNIAVISF